MYSEPITMWTKDAKRCVLHFAYGCFELVLHERGRLTRLSACPTEEAARRKAADWAAALDAVRRWPVVTSWNSCLSIAHSLDSAAAAPCRNVLPSRMRSRPETTHSS